MCVGLLRFMSMSRISRGVPVRGDMEHSLFATVSAAIEEADSHGDSRTCKRTAKVL